MFAMINSKIIGGVWNDTDVAMMDTRPHQCLCLAEPLPGQLHSLSLHVAADEASVRIHSGPTIRINGQFKPLPLCFFLADTGADPVEQSLGVVDFLSIAFNMLLLIWVAYGMSNYREVRALQ